MTTPQTIEEQLLLDVIEDARRGYPTGVILDNRKPQLLNLVWQAETKAYQLAILGKCPSCGQIVKDWKVPTGAFAPEAFATLREHNIDPGTGHKTSCQLRKEQS